MSFDRRYRALKKWMYQTSTARILASDRCVKGSLDLASAVFVNRTKYCYNLGLLTESTTHYLMHLRVVKKTNIWKAAKQAEANSAKISINGKSGKGDEK